MAVTHEERYVPSFVEFRRPRYSARGGSHRGLHATDRPSIPVGAAARTRSLESVLCMPRLALGRPVCRRHGARARDAGVRGRSRGPTPRPTCATAWNRTMQVGGQVRRRESPDRRVLRTASSRLQLSGRLRSCRRRTAPRARRRHPGCDTARSSTTASCGWGCKLMESALDRPALRWGATHRPGGSVSSSPPRRRPRRWLPRRHRP